ARPSASCGASSLDAGRERPAVAARPRPSRREVIVDGVVAAVPAMTILWTASRASAAAFPPVELADRVVRIAPDQAASPLLAGAVTLVYLVLAGGLAVPEACRRAPRGRPAAGHGGGCGAGAGVEPQPVGVP